MPSPRHWDAALYSRVGRLPTTRADVWLRRLSTLADNGKLWMLVAGALAAQRESSSLRRAAVRGLGSIALTSTVTNAVLKPVFQRRRPDYATVAPSRALRDN